VAVDILVAADAVARLLASGAVKRATEEAGDGMAAGILERVRKVFGSDTRSLEVLECVRADESSAAVGELVSALVWHARRDRVFAQELGLWAIQAWAMGVTQTAHAGRDAYFAGHDQKIVNYGPRAE
jgi:hypothetical protein